MAYELVFNDFLGKVMNPIFRKCKGPKKKIKKQKYKRIQKMKKKSRKINRR